ncbi:mitogen-activated protein kinase kinase kinase 5-like isoform X3 [Papaver somniferum]|uniref:mitogen-activated protein kinase kinase kinase 5-like isoform X3 n=1 Tax=Papaver somniferum TaxID=3469 RepID=UPI000E6F7E24|nr:mitogen-activated protein kinase kinase kinase 5-like isoform X3 [Papaver somniferum]
MPWWQKGSSSSSSIKSSSSSPSSSSINHNTLTTEQQQQQQQRINRFHQQPRLTRQRKLRHLREIDVEDNNQQRFIRSGSWTVTSPSPSSVGSSSANNNNNNTSGVPQPLPLPSDYNSFLLRRGDSESRLPLPSPKEDFFRKGDGGGDDIIDRDNSMRGDGVGDGIDFGSAIGSRFPDHHKGVEHGDNQSVKSQNGRGKKVILQGPIDVGKDQNNFLLNFPAKSAPASGLSSPVLSPRRMSTGDFGSTYIPSQGLQTWSTQEFAAADILHPGYSHRASPENIFASPDLSPLPSPRARSPGWNHLKSPSGPSSPLHHKSSLDSNSTMSSAWHDNSGHQVTGHRLPLPPGVAMPSMSTSSVPQNIVAKPETPSMTNQWQKGKLIGRGTFGSVYVASNRITGALCAMKEVDLIPDDAKSAECLNQLEQEIKVLSQLKHPNIVQYYGSETIGDHFYIYLEYVHPGSINKYVQEHCGAMTEDIVRNFTRHILSGLAYLHSKKTVHRDIKGANLLVDAHGVVKLADFGMAKHLNGHAANLSMKGSPYWMAPEVIHAALQNDSNSDAALAVDIWSLGCTIIEMLQGKPPWSQFEGAAALFKVLRENPPIPETLSPAGKDFLQLCFRRNPAERPSASMLLEHGFLRNSNLSEVTPNSHRPEVPSNSHRSEVPPLAQAFSGMRMDGAHSATELCKHRVDLLLSPASHTSSKGQMLFNNSESTGQQSHHLEPSDHAAAPRLSPRSTLETLPSSPPPNASYRGINHNTSKLSLNGVNGVHLGPGTSRPYALPLSMDSQSGSSTSLLRGVDQNYDRLIMQHST